MSLRHVTRESSVSANVTWYVSSTTSVTSISESASRSSARDALFARASTGTSRSSAMVWAQLE